MLVQLVMVATAAVFHGLIRLRIPVEVAIVDQPASATDATA
jgi:hypothetical protein